MCFCVKGHHKSVFHLQTHSSTFISGQSNLSYCKTNGIIRLKTLGLHYFLKKPHNYYLKAFHSSTFPDDSMLKSHQFYVKIKQVGSIPYNPVTHSENLCADISMLNTREKVTQQWLRVASWTEANICIDSDTKEVGWHNESHICPKSYATVPNTASLCKKQGAF